MLNNWLSPLDKGIFDHFKPYDRSQFAKKLLIHKDKDHFPQLTNAKMAIIGIGE